MYEGFQILPFLGGLLIGVLVTGLIFYWDWCKGKQERRFDERYKIIHRKSKTISWGITTIALLIGWAIIIMMEGPSLSFFIFTAIWIIHILSYLIVSVVVGRDH